MSLLIDTTIKTLMLKFSKDFKKNGVTNLFINLDCVNNTGVATHKKNGIVETSNFNDAEVNKTAPKELLLLKFAFKQIEFIYNYEMGSFEFNAINLKDELKTIIIKITK